jgi:hypothetical protein
MKAPQKLCGAFSAIAVPVVKVIKKQWLGVLCKIGLSGHCRKCDRGAKCYHLDLYRFPYGTAFA